MLHMQNKSSSTEYADISKQILEYEVKWGDE